MFRTTALSSLAFLAFLAIPTLAQTTETTTTTTSTVGGDMAPVDVSTVDTSALETEEGLLTDAELQTLVAPVALYPTPF